MNTNFFRNKYFLSLVIACVLNFIFLPLVFAQNKVVIKLASIAPENTPWGETLNKMAKDWDSISGGKVELRVYHNGVSGSEADVLRKLKLNQIQAAVFSSVGLELIAPEVMTLSLPLLLHSDAEFDTVFSQLQGDLEKHIVAAGFHPVAWNKAGWVRIFSRHPVRLPADLKKLKFGMPPTTGSMNNTFKAMGYNIIPVDINDTIMAFNSGAMDATFTSPISAAPTQIFGIAKNMSEFKVAPFLGAIVVNAPGWNSIPQQYRDRIVASTAKTGSSVDPKIKSLEEQAVKTMQNYGLNIVKQSEADMALWYADIDKAIPALIASKTIDKDLYQKINTILKSIRK